MRSLATRLPFTIRVYRTATALLEPAGAALLLWRRRAGKEDPTRLAERRGYPGFTRPEGRLIWLHGASVGETTALTPLIAALIARGLNVLVTSGTLTSANLLRRRLPPHAIHQFLPLDVPRYMRRFLDHWQPEIGLICESEIWPNMIIEAHRRDIPLVMVNGRMSERSFRRWGRMPETARAMISGFEICLAQSQADGARLAELGAPRVNIAGNLKFDVAPPPADPNAMAILDGLVAGRPLWVAASTHPGEDEQVVDVHLRLREALPGLLTIIVPRHPARGVEIERMVKDQGLSVGRRAQGLSPDSAVEVYIADTLGEIGLFFRLASVVFMGATLVPNGGHNPIEPAKLGAAIVHGPHVANAAEVFAALDAAGGALMVKDSEALARVVYYWLSDPRAARDAARAASTTVEDMAGAVPRTMQAIEPLLLRAALDRQTRTRT